MKTKKIPWLRKKKIYKLISDDLTLQLFKFNRIRDIILFKDEESKSKYRGKILPLIKRHKLYFDIFYDDTIGEKCLKNKELNSTEKSILFHEFFHCHEMLITSQYINKNLYFKLSDSTKSFLIYTAIQQWSEYYAYFYTAKISDRNINIAEYFTKINGSFTLLAEKLQETESIQLPDSYLSLIVDFISKYIMLAAYFNSTKDVKYLNMIRRFKYGEQLGKLYEFVIDMMKYLDKLFKTYPKWCSESLFEKIGNELTSFIRIYNIKFSNTNDFSVELKQ